MTAPVTGDTGTLRLDSDPNLFIAWGGEWSRRVAAALYHWLPGMIDAARPWMSEESLRTGTEWFSEVKRQLARVAAAIVCLTPDNLLNHWIHFEAGAIANRGLPQNGVMLYLIGVQPKEVVPPFSLFQGQIAADKSKTFKLVKDINVAIRANVREDRLASRFESEWPRLESSLSDAKPTGEQKAKERTPESMLAEILLLIRSVGAGVSQALSTSEQALLRAQGFVGSGSHEYDRFVSQVALAEAMRAKVTAENEDTVALKRDRLSELIRSSTNSEPEKG